MTVAMLCRDHIPFQTTLSLYSTLLVVAACSLLLVVILYPEDTQFISVSPSPSSRSDLFLVFPCSAKLISFLVI